MPESQPFIAQRMAASSQAKLDGSATVAMSQINAEVQGADLVLTSLSGASGSAAGWGMYRFNGAPGDRLDSIGFTSLVHAHPGGQHMWVAISNYGQHHWEWFDAGLSGISETALDSQFGSYFSPGGQMYVLILAFGGMGFDVNSVYANFSHRQPVSGKVTEFDGTPIAGALVASPAFALSTLTASDGSYTLGFPQGSWPLVVTKNGFTFYSNPQVATVNQTAVDGVDFVGRQNGAHYEPGDPDPLDNNALSTATVVTIDGASASGTLSATDDPVDCLRFSIAEPGQYCLEFHNSHLQIYFPYLTLYSGEEQEIFSVPSPVAGTVRLPFLCGVAGQQFIVRVSCSGGGGDYELQASSGTCEHLRGQVLLDPPATQSLDGVLVNVTNSVQGDVTRYLTDIDGVYEEYYRAPVSTVVKPSAPSLSFAPAEASISLAAGPQLNCDFTATPDSLADHYEPNNSVSDALDFAALPLPYDSLAAGDSLSVSADTDWRDYYVVSPASGACLKASLAVSSAHPADSGLELSILSGDGFRVLANGYRTATGLEARLPQPVAENHYYICVGFQDSSHRSHSYQLKASTYDGYPLTFRVNCAKNTGLPNALIQLRLPDDAHAAQAYYMHDLPTRNNGVTSAEYFAAGEKIQAQLLRYGLNTNGYTQAVTMPAVPLLVDFSADPALSAEHYEPNDSIETAAALSLPQGVDATLDPVTDQRDFYLLTLPANVPLQARLTQPGSPSGHFKLNLERADGFSYGRPELWSGGPTALFTVPEAGQYILEVDNPGQPATYHLNLQTGPAYHLTGAGQVPLLMVYCPELQQSVLPNLSGHYDFGAVPPGVYTLKAYAKGSTVTPTQSTVTITAADAGQDFTGVANPVDALEPNGSKDNPITELPTDGTVSPLMSVGTDQLHGDTADMFGIQVTAGQLVTVRATRGQVWWPGVQFGIYDPDKELLSSVVTIGGAEQTATFVAPKTGLYEVWILGGPVEYTLDITARN